MFRPLIFRVPFLIFRVPSLLFRVPSLIFRVPFLIFRVPSLLFRVPSLIFRVLSLIFRVPSLISRLPFLIFRVPPSSDLKTSVARVAADVTSKTPGLPFEFFASILDTSLDHFGQTFFFFAKEKRDW